MTMTFSGDGTITGLVAGGLPNATVTNDDLSLSANASNVMTALNASGSAPIYACRAWVNFNGTGTVAIRASGNVSSITDNGTGDYTVNFTTAMPDANYSMSGSGPVEGSYFSTTVETVTTTYSTTQCRFRVFGWTSGTAGVTFDASIVDAHFFR